MLLSQSSIWHLHDYSLGMMANWGIHPVNLHPWWADVTGIGVPVAYSGEVTRHPDPQVNNAVESDIDLARDALPLLDEISHPHLGLTLNLAHEMRNGQGHAIVDTVDLVWERLNCVTINGTDAVPEGERMRDWARLVQPLGAGSHDPLPLLRKLADKGYTGPMGLQCFKLEGPPAEHLARSMQAWRKYLGDLEP